MKLVIVHQVVVRICPRHAFQRLGQNLFFASVIPHLTDHRYFVARVDNCALSV